MTWELWIKQNILTGKLRFKDPLGQDYPQWETVQLKDILNCETSKHELADVDKDQVGKFPIFNRGEIYKRVPWYDMETDYIALSIAGNPGNCRLYPKCTSINSTQAYLYPKEGIDVNLRWIFANVIYINFDKYIQGSTIKGLRWKDIKRETIPLPCNDEQNKIGDFIGTFALYSQLMSEELRLWKLMKKAMLQKLFI